VSSIIVNIGFNYLRYKVKETPSCRANLFPFRRALVLKPPVGAMGKSAGKLVDHNKNLALVEDLIAPDFREHAGSEVRRVGIEGFNAARLRRNAAFPDWKVTVDDIIAEGDKVVVRATGQGTHLGEYMGIPPTGRRIKVSWIAIYRIADGKLAEHWQQIDELGLRQQLGATLTLPSI
jgi:steroid delta-isomerase-like uncharacterized protein